MFEDLCGEDNIQFFAGHVDDATADGAQYEIENDGKQKSNRESDEGGNCAVGDYTVVNVHDEQRRCQRQHVHNKGCDSDVRVVWPKALNR